MTLRKTILNSLALLSARNRRILALVIGLLTASGLLDLLGIALLGLVAALSVSVLADTATPVGVQRIAEHFGLGSMDIASLAVLLAAVAGLALISKTAITLYLNRRTLRFLATREAVVSAELTSRLLSRSLRDIESKTSQDVAYSLTIGTRAATVDVLGAATLAASDAALLLLLGGGLLIVDPIVALFAIVFFASFAIVIQRSLSSWVGRLGKIQAQTDVKSYQKIQEALRAYRELTVLHRRTSYVDQIQRLRWQSARVSADTQFLGIIPRYAFEVVLVAGGFALALSQFATRDAAAAVGVLAIFLAAASRVMPAIMRLQTAALTIRRASGVAAPTYQLSRDLTDAGPLDPADPDDCGQILDRIATDNFEFDPSLVVRDVTVTYPGSDLPALDAITFSAKPGSSVALVGSTGAGKSTLADVILGVLPPDAGSVLIGELSPLDAIRTWPGALAYVPQEVALIHGTVRDNVALGLPNEIVDDERVWEALGRAHLSSFLIEQRQGLDTPVGEHGIRLSGGQRQRLGVARALYTRPRFLVLDEATSALDAETEHAISVTLRELEGEVTTVIIAHRLATIRHCDAVLFLEGGCVLASGTFDQVRRVSPAFHAQATLLGL